MSGTNFKLTPVEGKKKQSNLDESQRRAQTNLVKEDKGIVSREELGFWLWGATRA